jgi:hypothetical protein
MTRKQREALLCAQQLKVAFKRPPTFAEVGRELGISSLAARRRLEKLRGSKVDWVSYFSRTLKFQ